MGQQFPSHFLEGFDFQHSCFPSLVAEIQQFFTIQSSVEREYKFVRFSRAIKVPDECEFHGAKLWSSSNLKQHSASARL